MLFSLRHINCGYVLVMRAMLFFFFLLPVPLPTPKSAQRITTDNVRRGFLKLHKVIQSGKHVVPIQQIGQGEPLILSEG